MINIPKARALIAAATPDNRNTSGLYPQDLAFPPLTDTEKALTALAPEVARCRELEIEVKAQHDEHVARYGQAIAAEEKCSTLEAEIKRLNASDRAIVIDLRAEVARLDRERGEYRNSFHDKIIEAQKLEAEVARLTAALDYITDWCFGWDDRPEPRPEAAEVFKVVRAALTPAAGGEDV